MSAKQHCKRLQTVARKLDEAKGNYTVRRSDRALGSSNTDASLCQAAVVTLNATTIANVNAHVQAYTLLVGTTPVYAPGTCRVDADTHPFEA